jgi:alpha-ketoglutarate-dependent taurine dioxygenase
VLRGVVIPPVGGDTVWANTVAAYATLPPRLRGVADQLWARHSDVVIWDDRARQHKAIDDYGNEPRIVRRVTIDGPVSVGIDGGRGPSYYQRFLSSIAMGQTGRQRVIQ